MRWRKANVYAVRGKSRLKKYIKGGKKNIIFYPARRVFPGRGPNTGKNCKRRYAFFRSCIRTFFYNLYISSHLFRRREFRKCFFFFMPCKYKRFCDASLLTRLGSNLDALFFSTVQPVWRAVSVHA